jgi:hypothetical protein
MLGCQNHFQKFWDAVIPGVTGDQSSKNPYITYGRGRVDGAYCLANRQYASYTIYTDCRINVLLRLSEIHITIYNSDLRRRLSPHKPPQITVVKCISERCNSTFLRGYLTICKLFKPHQGGFEGGAAPLQAALG